MYGILVRAFPSGLLVFQCEWHGRKRTETAAVSFPKKTLDLFLERGAISASQHDKGLRDLTVKMGIAAEYIAEDN